MTKSLRPALCLAPIVALCLAPAAHAQFTYTYFPSDTTITSDVTTDFATVGFSGGGYDESDFSRHFTGPSSPTVTVGTGANIATELDVFNHSVLNVVDGSIGFTAALDNSTINILGGSTSFLVSVENSVVRMSAGYVSDLEGQGKSMRVSGGTVDFLVANSNTDYLGTSVLGSCLVDVTGGSFFRAEAQNQGILNIRGGTFTQRLVAAFGGTLNIYGTGLNATLLDPSFSPGGGSTYQRYSLSGTLADGTVLVDQAMLVRNDQPGVDGSAGFSSFHLLSASAPEPGTLALALCGILGVGLSATRARIARGCGEAGRQGGTTGA